ncbi:hypothetical protein V1478_001067 [Vespula squamosa]|uniref:Uncharacterized protein n=1 Tax=Vespula squamosa TaxID=30214 RepID=A0ABD2C799_VESSQ
MKLSRKEIFNIFKDNLCCPINEAYQKIEHLVSTRFKCSYTLSVNMKQICRNLLYSFRRKWRQVKKADNFFRKYDKWLNVSIIFYKSPVVLKTSRSECSNLFPNLINSNFIEKTIEEIPSCSHSTELSCVPRTGNIVSESSNEDENGGRHRNSVLTTISDDYALSLLMEIRLSRSQYEVLRATNVENNCNIYPPYKTLLQAKEKCYPPKTDIKIKDCSAEVKLQGLLDHSVEQILFIKRDYLKNSTSEYISNMTLFCKWGYTEISGENFVNRNFNSNTEITSDSNVFSISIVPLQLISYNLRTKTQYTIWENPSPSSVRFCRPIKLQFNHESKQDYISEYSNIKEQEGNLVSFITVFDGKLITVNYNLTFVITNSQVCNATLSTLEEEYCFVCNSEKMQFNNIDEILREGIDRSNYTFGLSIPYVWIRFFESCLDLSYKLHIKKWKLCTEADKLIVENRKINIQIGLNLQFGFIIDKKKADFKNSDESAARCFFENSTTSALITGVDRILLKRFCVILQALSSNHKINNRKFHDYAVKTAKRLVRLYPWYNMSITVHTILIHGPKVIKSALLPIDQFYSDAQQDLHIDRSFQDILRVKNIEEVFLELLALSDPYISSLRDLPQTKLKNLTTEVIDLLILPDTIMDDDDEDTSDDYYDSDIDE